MSWGSDSPTQSKLPGHKVVQLIVNEDESTLGFICEDGYTEFWGTEGDCCSRSWWSDVYERSALKGEVQSVESIGLPKAFYDVEADRRDRSEEDQAYGFQIRTTWGVCTLVFRNASNGYYGGWAFIGSAGTGNWRQITENDWSA